MENTSSPTKTLETDIIQENPIEEHQLESPRRSIRRRKLVREDDEEETPEQSQGEEEEITPVPSKGIVSSSSKKRVERFESRYVLGFCVDLEWANKVEFQELTSIVKEQGMEFLFEFAFNNGLVPQAMDELCANFVNTNGTCTTEVRGKKKILFFGKLRK